MQYDVLIVGGGPGGIYSAYELLEKRPDLKIALFEAGHALARRHCPIDGVKVKSCVKCPTCAIMNGFGGAGAFSDGKYNITNQFGGTLHEYIGKKQALELMEYVDEINVANGGEGTHLYSTGATPIKKLCLENDLHLLDASVRHLGTDKNLVVLEHLYNRLKDKMDIYFDTPVQSVERTDGGYRVVTDKGSYDGRYCVISVGRSGSKWMEIVCKDLHIKTNSNRVDIGVRVELPAEIFSHLTDELYEEAKKNGYFVMSFDWRDSLNVSLQWCDDVANTDVLAEFAEGYTGPVLAIHGKEDTTVDPEWSNKIEAASKNEASKTYFIEGMDHTFNVFSEEDFHSLYNAVDATGEFFKTTLAD